MNELITITLMAGALGMDAFSVALGMGMLGLRMKRIFIIGLVIGIFHVIMPLIGMATGIWMSSFLGVITIYIGGALLLIIGLQMVYSCFKSEEEPYIRPVGWGLFVFALSVSIDSFSAGLSFGMLGAKTILTVTIIGVFSMVLSWIGLILGSRLQNFVGAYGVFLGGCILVIFGMKLLLP
ncbi:membrane protein [Alkalihalobacillus alcalophilus ATCC 27647 = CGMCC 1.3604]|uniref:Putative manganese efflux pump MntP n=1 Tax=Alkalihalobacillus alcalophilus ATCC 27647 = CGMCC 1.3604 TaxID=1218173 RepID=A0A094WJM3_ALKAL|nr:manganese efflux pump MntP family protein [Alkalihalobacillus alcalophilus]KGA97041.1 membrane protein [Alkalihalobacillus alcalophilus ATCC 27647 = CGMCC 1.3604]MED1561124.1 manganese efflux pump MntP family protein [Alkalihalobacillus alcalophilus]THG89120.1 membrane protein [Alkalihalobacillus alcalophilus ATCC 27647 = CGMCC 1.3604]